MMDLREAALAIGAAATSDNPIFSAVSTDTRKVGQGELFVALRGENFDGNDFVVAAAERGAIAAIVDADWAQSHPQAIPLLAVDDTRRAFGLLAAHWRQKFEIPLIGVTGSDAVVDVALTLALLAAFASVAFVHYVASAQRHEDDAGKAAGEDS